jgi:eukaryotic-like serine/threonine-protein kinase
MLRPGTMVGGYQLVERCAGVGGRGVWRAKDWIGHDVAVKFLRPSLVATPDLVRRLRADARAMAAIDHRGIVFITDCGIDESAGPFMVMRYVEGESLRSELARVGRLTPGRTMDLVARAADALQAAHEQGVVHGAVNADHLLLWPDDHLVLISFTLGRSIEDDLSEVGSVMRHTTYFSPEQAMGERATDRSDIFALGMVAHQCLAGQPPFEGDNPVERALRVARDPVPALPSHVPPDVRAVVEGALAKDPDARWLSAAALAQAARAAGT